MIQSTKVKGPVVEELCPNPDHWSERIVFLQCHVCDVEKPKPKKEDEQIPF